MEVQVPFFEEIRAILKEIATAQKEAQQAAERRQQEFERRQQEAQQEAERRQQEFERRQQEAQQAADRRQKKAQQAADRKQKEFERRKQEADLRLQEIDRIMQETALSMKDTDRRMKSFGIELNGISKSNGDFAEEYFNNAFEKDNLIFAGMHFDYLKNDINVSNPKSGKRDEQYDLVLYNDESVVIIEIKYKACKNDIYDIIRKAETFRGWFPEYADHKIYLGLAGMSFLRNTIKNAENKGIAIIRQRGDKTIVNDKNLIAY